MIERIGDYTGEDASHRLHIWAAQFGGQLKSDEMIEQRKARGLRDLMKSTLSYDDKTGIEDILLAQTKALDEAFRQLLIKASQENGTPAEYTAAFRAQNQFRHTAVTLQALEDRKEKAGTN